MARAQPMGSIFSLRLSSLTPHPAPATAHNKPRLNKQGAWTNMICSSISQPINLLVNCGGCSLGARDSCWSVGWVGTPSVELKERHWNFNVMMLFVSEPREPSKACLPLTIRWPGTQLLDGWAHMPSGRGEVFSWLNSNSMVQQAQPEAEL